MNTQTIISNKFDLNWSTSFSYIFHKNIKHKLIINQARNLIKKLIKHALFHL